MKLSRSSESAAAADVGRAGSYRRCSSVKWSGEKAVVVRDAELVQIVSLVNDNTGLLHWHFVDADDDAMFVLSS